MAKRLHFFWIEFGSEARFPEVGVTAFNLDDAINLVHARLFNDGGAASQPSRVVEDVRVFSLDKERVLSNKRPLLRQGVWYPDAGKKSGP